MSEPRIKSGVIAADTLKPGQAPAAGRAISASVALQSGQRAEVAGTPQVEKEL